MKKAVLNFKSLKEQVYEYLREEFRKHRLKPGAMINIDETSKELGISRTPLRDALLQLEIEGFVTIVPRRGIYVNQLTLEDIQEFYQVIGTLEHAALLASAKVFKQDDLDKMTKLNEEMKKAVANNDFDLFYDNNLAFHNVFIDLTGNKTLVQIINNLKKRLYDLPRPEKWIKEWEEGSTKEHDILLNFLKEGQFEKAADHVKSIHWSFDVQESNIKKYYNLD